MASTSKSSTTKTLLLGLSGPSSSGKSTLARFLRSIFTVPASPATQGRSISLFILHEDDFYKTDVEIPIITTSPDCPSGLSSREFQDWDCVGSIDIPLLASTLQYIKSHSGLPLDSFSKEDQNELGPTSVPVSFTEARQAETRTWLEELPTNALPEGSGLRICILDGFLVYTDPKSGDNEMTQLHDLTELMDLKLFVSCSRSQTIERRTRRKGYVTLEGFWEDPPGYVEDVVWPNFVRDHAWLCKGEGEEGHLVIDEDAARREHIVLGPGRGEKELEELIIWGVDAVKEAAGR